LVVPVIGLTFLSVWSYLALRALPQGDDITKRWRPSERRGVGVTLPVLLPLASLLCASLATATIHDFAFVAITTLMSSELLALVAARAWFGAR
jgi:hypothetical protein